jgi:methyl-galactoside transport system ATP-binding protein
MADGDFILEMRDISKEFPGVKALDKARLSLRPGTVHALMGENGAGKSTLMKCLFGIYGKDSGEIVFDGKPVNFENPRRALDNGVSMVHQELNQVLERNVVDNIWLGRIPMKGLIVDERRMLEDTQRIFQNLGILINPKKKIGSLSVSERQMVEIAKAVSCDAKVLVLDEPTSSLTENEVEHLFRIIKALKKEGVAVIYISHKMEEILAISDEVTVMRDGKWVATERAADLTKDRIVSLMVGRDLTHLFPRKDNAPGDKVALSVRKLTAAYQPSIIEASFDLYEGEILGVAGLMGSRRTELVETIFGLRKMESGEILVDGAPVGRPNPRSSIAHGLGLLTEERRATGIFALLNIQFNAMIANINAYCSKLGVMNHKLAAKDTQWVIDRMAVKTPSQRTAIGNLSGGNQQKVILGRWLLTSPKILLLDEPTRGIDVGAKYEIYQLMIDLAKQGNSLVFISSEMPELLGVADRILVMSNGRVAGIVGTAEASQEKILELAAKYL